MQMAELKRSETKRMIKSAVIAAATDPRNTGSVSLNAE